MLTRRDFIAELAFAGAAMAPIAMLPAGIFGPGPMCARAAVVSIHMDQPYLDTTGRALPMCRRTAYALARLWRI